MKTNKQVIDEWAETFGCKGHFLYEVEVGQLEKLCDKVRNEYTTKENVQNQENNLFCKINELEKRLEKLEKKPKSDGSAYDLNKSKQNIPEGWTTTRRGGLRQLGVYDG